MMQTQLDVKSNIGGAIELLGTFGSILDQIGHGALREDLAESTFIVANNRFNKYAWTLAKDELAHMFEWGAKENRPENRLWVMHLSIVDYTVMYDYQVSKKDVPVHPELEDTTRFRHVFREKARVLEEAPKITINRDQSAWLRWHADSRGRHRTEANISSPVIVEDGVAKSKGPVELAKAGGGRYQGEFQDAFLMFWATGGNHTMEDVKRALTRSVHTRLAIDQSQTRKLAIDKELKRLSAYKGISRSGYYSADTRREADKKIMQIKKDLKAMRFNV